MAWPRGRLVAAAAAAIGGAVGVPVAGQQADSVFASRAARGAIVARHAQADCDARRNRLAATVLSLRDDESGGTPAGLPTGCFAPSEPEPHLLLSTGAFGPRPYASLPAHVLHPSSASRRDEWAGAECGGGAHGRVVLCTGPAGIGKTTLVRRVLAALPHVPAVRVTLYHAGDDDDDDGAAGDGGHSGALTEQQRLDNALVDTVEGAMQAQEPVAYAISRWFGLRERTTPEAAVVAVEDALALLNAASNAAGSAGSGAGSSSQLELPVVVLDAGNVPIHRVLGHTSVTATYFGPSTPTSAHPQSGLAQASPSVPPLLAPSHGHNGGQSPVRAASPPQSDDSSTFVGTRSETGAWMRALVASGSAKCVVIGRDTRLDDGVPPPLTADDSTTLRVGSLTRHAVATCARDAAPQLFSTGLGAVASRADGAGDADAGAQPAAADARAGDSDAVVDAIVHATGGRVDDVLWVVRRAAYHFDAGDTATETPATKHNNGSSGRVPSAREGNAADEGRFDPREHFGDESPAAAVAERASQSRAVAAVARACEELLGTYESLARQALMVAPAATHALVSTAAADPPAAASWRQSPRPAAADDGVDATATSGLMWTVMWVLSGRVPDLMMGSTPVAKQPTGAGAAKPVPMVVGAMSDVSWRRLERLIADGWAEFVPAAVGRDGRGARDADAGNVVAASEGSLGGGDSNGSQAAAKIASGLGAAEGGSPALSNTDSSSAAADVGPPPMMPWCTRYPLGDLRLLALRPALARVTERLLDADASVGAQLHARMLRHQLTDDEAALAADSDALAADQHQHDAAVRHVEMQCRELDDATANLARLEVVRLQTELDVRRREIEGRAEVIARNRAKVEALERGAATAVDAS